LLLSVSDRLLLFLHLLKHDDLGGDGRLTAHEGRDERLIWAKARVERPARARVTENFMMVV
jgi:hypothetical protein